MPEVYEAKNSVNGHRYIGVTKYTMEKRRYQHYWCARRGQSHMPFLVAVQKHGEDAFEWKVIARFASHEDAIRFEIDAIRDEKPEYNATSGGQGICGITRSDEWKKRMSDIFKSRPVTQGQLERMREARLQADNRKSVINLKDLSVYRSHKDAASYYGIKIDSVGLSVRAKGFTSDGHAFSEYIDITKERAEAEMNERLERIRQRRLGGQRGRGLASRYRKSISIAGITPGDARHSAKLSPSEVDEIRTLRGAERQIDTAARFVVSLGTISRIQLGKSWKAPV